MEKREIEKLLNKYDTQAKTGKIITENSMVN